MSEPAATLRSRQLAVVFDALTLSGGTYLSRALRLAAGFVRARYLGPGLFGVWNGLMVIADYSAHATLGIGRAADRELPRATGQQDQEAILRIRETTFTVFFCQGAILCLGLIVIGLAVWPTVGPVVGLGLCTIGGLVFLLRIMDFLDIVLRVDHRFPTISLGLVLLWGSHLGLLFVLVPLGGMFGFYGVVLSSYALLVAYWLAMYRPYLPRRLRFDWPEMWRLTKIGLPLTISVVLANVMGSVDRIMALTFLGAEALGLYSLGLMIITAMLEIPMVIEAVLMPRMFRRFGEDKSVETFRPFFKMPLLVLSLIVPALLVGVAALLPPLVGEFLPRFLDALPVVRVLLFVALFGSLTVPSYNLLFGMDRQSRLILVNGVSIPVAVGLNVLFLALGWGLLGISLAMVTTYFLVCSALLSSGFAYFVESIGRRVWQLLRAFLPGLTMLGTMVVLQLVWPPGGADFWQAVGLPVFRGVWSPTVMGFWPAIVWSVLHGLLAVGLGGAVWVAVNFGTREWREVVEILWPGRQAPPAAPAA